MFVNVSGAAPEAREAREVRRALEVLGQRARPTTLAAERALPVLPALAPLVPGGRLARGSTVAVAGAGATSLALGLVAAASSAGSWAVVVGQPDLGLAAVAEAGVELGRLVLVTAPPAERWGTVVAALVETVELVLVRPTVRVRAADARRLAAHLRARGGVLVRLPGPGCWPEPADLTLRAAAAEWRGAVPSDRRDGAGRLTARRVVVEAVGRRQAARPRRAELWLPAPSDPCDPLLAADSEQDRSHLPQEREVWADVG